MDAKSEGLISFQDAKENLKDFYIQHYEDIMEELVIGSLSLADVIGHFNVVCDSDDPPKYVPSFSIPDLFIQRKLIIHDCSGIGLFTVSYFLLGLWGCGGVPKLDQYELVLFVSMKQLSILRGCANVSEIIIRLLKIYIGKGVDIADLDLDQVLFVVDGYDGFFLNRRGVVELSDDAQQLFPIISGQKNVLVFSTGQEASVFDGYVNYKMSLLPPIMHLEYRRNSTKEICKRMFYGQLIYLRAKLTLDDAFQTIATDANEGTVQDSATSLHQELIQAFLYGTPINAAKRTVSHKANLVSATEILSYLLDENAVVDDPVQLLICPGDWYAAATTTLAEGDKSKFYSYNIGGYLVLMTSHDHYVSVLGKISDIKANLREALLANADEGNAEIKEEIHDLRNRHPDDVVLRKLQSLLGKPVYAAKFKALRDFLDGVFHLANPKKSSMRAYRSASMQFSNKDDQVNRADYRTLQLALNDLDLDASELMDAMSGMEVARPETAEILAAIMLSEVGRYHYAFLATLCYLDLVDTANSVGDPYGMSRSLCHPRSALTDNQKESQLNDVKLAMKLDCFDALGGFLPLCHDNSFNQVSKLPSASIYLVNWVEFKSMVIIADWLVLQAKLNNKNNFFRMAYSVDDSEEWPLASKDDQDYVASFVLEFNNTLTLRLQDFELMSKEPSFSPSVMAADFLNDHRDGVEFNQESGLDDAVDRPPYKRYLIFSVSHSQVNLKAVMHMRAGRNNEALGLLDSILIKNPSYSPALFNRARVLYDEHKYQAALDDCLVLLGQLGLESKYIRSITLIAAKCCFYLGSYSSALSFLQAHIEGSEQPDAYACYLFSLTASVYYRQLDASAQEKIQKLEAVLSYIDTCLNFRHQLNERQIQKITLLRESIASEVQYLENQRDEESVRLSFL